MPIVRPSKAEIEKARREQDWTGVDAMSDEELTANAASDPDNPPFTEEEFVAMPAVPDVAAIRRKLGMTQPAFAARFRVPLATLRDWEQKRRVPGPTVMAYLQVIEREPEAVGRALGANRG